MLKYLISHFRRHANEPARIAIEGVRPAPVTAEPDDAEIAAQAILDSLSKNTRKKETVEKPAENQPQETHDADYYRRLVTRIRKARTSTEWHATRFVACCESQLENPHLPLTGDNSVELLEAELYKRIDVIERAGGELKRRWQRCLADVTVRLINAGKEVI